MPQNSLTPLPTSGDALTRATSRFREKLMVQFGKASERLGIEIDAESITLGFNGDSIVATAAAEEFGEFDLADIAQGINVGIVYLSFKEESPTTEDERKIPPDFYVVSVKGTSAELRDSSGKPVRTGLPVSITPGGMTSAGPRSGGIVIARKDVQVSYEGLDFTINVGDVCPTCGPPGNPGVGKGP